MTIEEAVIEKLRELPAEKQREVLDFVEFLAALGKPIKLAPKPRRKLIGLLADLDIRVTDEDIKEARREMWADFAREIQ